MVGSNILKQHELQVIRCVPLVLVVRGSWAGRGPGPPYSGENCKEGPALCSGVKDYREYYWGVLLSYEPRLLQVCRVTPDDIICRPSFINE